MVYVDTNILIRLMTNDIPTLRQQAEQIVDAQGPRDIHIADAVLAELFFVLHNHAQYGFARAAVCEMVSDLLTRPQFDVSSSAVTALQIAARYPKLDFTDCLLAAYANGQAPKLLSFDKLLLRTCS